jgi:hypothetical protein
MRFSIRRKYDVDVFVKIVSRRRGLAASRVRKKKCFRFICRQTLLGNDGQRRDVARYVSTGDSLPTRACGRESENIFSSEHDWLAARAKQQSEGLEARTTSPRRQNNVFTDIPSRLSIVQGYNLAETR